MIIIRCVLLGLGNVSYYSCRENKKKISYEIFYQKSLCLRDNHEKYDKAENIK